VAELKQLALDPLVAPAVVLGGEPLDERGDLGADRRPSRRAVCPVEPGPGVGAAQDGDFMAQHEQLGVLGGR
jgi:hypothetical protein